MPRILVCRAILYISGRPPFLAAELQVKTSPVPTSVALTVTPIPSPPCTWLHSHPGAVVWMGGGGREIWLCTTTRPRLTLPWPCNYHMQSAKFSSSCRAREGFVWLLVPTPNTSCSSLLPLLCFAQPEVWSPCLQFGAFLHWGPRTQHATYNSCLCHLWHMCCRLAAPVSHASELAKEHVLKCLGKARDKVTDVELKSFCVCLFVCFMETSKDNYIWAEAAFIFCMIRKKLRLPKLVLNL